jgi:hypothetical protein
MIIQVEGASAGDVAEAKRGLEELAAAWGVRVTEVPSPEKRDLYDGVPTRGVDPVALTTMILAIPPAALAVVDTVNRITDRIAKRKRAKDLNEFAVQWTEKQVTTHVVTETHTVTRTVELRLLNLDQILDLAGEEDA